MSGLVIGLVSFCQNQTKNLILLFLFPYKVIQNVFKELKSRDDEMIFHQEMISSPAPGLYNWFTGSIIFIPIHLQQKKLAPKE